MVLGKIDGLEKSGVDARREKMIEIMKSPEKKSDYIFDCYREVLENSNNKFVRHILGFIKDKIPHFTDEKSELFATVRVAMDENATEGMFDLPKNEMIDLGRQWASRELTEFFVGLKKVFVDEAHHVTHFRLELLFKNACKILSINAADLEVELVKQETLKQIHSIPDNSTTIVSEVDIEPNADHVLFEIVEHDIQMDETVDSHDVEEINIGSEEIILEDQTFIGEEVPEPENVETIVFDQKVAETKVEPEEPIEVNNITLDEIELDPEYEDVSLLRRPESIDDFEDIYEPESYEETVSKSGKPMRHALYSAPTTNVFGNDNKYTYGKDGFEHMTRQIGKIRVLSNEEVNSLMFDIIAGKDLRKSYNFLIKGLQLRFYQNVLRKISTKKFEESIYSNAVVELTEDERNIVRQWFLRGNVDSFVHIQLIDKFLILLGDEIHEHEIANKSTLTKYHFDYLFHDEYGDDRTLLCEYFGISQPDAVEKDVAIKAVEARKKMFHHNQRMVLKLITEKNRFHDIDKATAFQYGCIGLYYAIEDFDPARKKTFYTFANPRIFATIFRNSKLESGESIAQVNAKMKLTGFQKKFFHDYGREPTEEEVCDALGIIPKRYQKLMGLSREVSLDQTFSEDSENTLMDVLAVSSGFESDVDNSISTSDILDVINNDLNLKDRELMEEFFGLNGKVQKSMIEMAQEAGCDRRNIHQKYKRIVAFIKGRLETIKSEEDEAVNHF